MKFAIVIALLFTLKANAQKASLNVIAPTQYTTADTLRALQRLFKIRRTSGAILVGFSSGVVTASNIAVNNDPIVRPGEIDNFIIATGISALYTIPFWSTGTSQLVRFNKKKEQVIINDFTTKHTLPRKIQRRLKPSLFASH